MSPHSHCTQRHTYYVALMLVVCIGDNSMYDSACRSSAGKAGGGGGKQVLSCHQMSPAQMMHPHQVGDTSHCSQLAAAAESAGCSWQERMKEAELWHAVVPLDCLQQPCSRTSNSSSSTDVCLSHQLKHHPVIASPA